MVSRVGEWLFYATPTPPPASGQLRLDTVSQTAATKMWISKTTATSVDATNYLMAVSAGQEIYFQDKDNFTKWQVYKVVAPPIAAPQHVEFPVVWNRGGGVDIPYQRVFLAIDEVPTAEILTSPFAFPSTTAFGVTLGMTIRQIYAAHAMHGFITSGAVAQNLTGGVLAKWAFQVADSMLQLEEEERNPKPPIASTGAPVAPPAPGPAPAARKPAWVK